MKTYRAKVVTTGSFVSVQTVEAKSVAEALRKFKRGEGVNEDSAYDWDTWTVERTDVITPVKKDDQ